MYAHKGEAAQPKGDGALKKNCAGRFILKHNKQMIKPQDSSMVSIKTKRLTLREFKDSDLPAVHEYAQDPETTKYLEWGPNTLKETTVFLNESLGFQRDKPRLTFDMAIILDQDNKLIGACSVTILDKKKRIAALGYVLSSTAWGHGYATEAASAIAKFAFEELGMDKILATCDALNVASERVMEKVGMQKESKLAKDKFIKGMYRDTLVYSITHSSWLARSNPVNPASGG